MSSGADGSSLTPDACRRYVSAGTSGKVAGLTEKIYATRHTTIGSVLDAGLRIHAFCLDCRHAEDVDMRVLARKLGRKHSTLPVHLVPKLVCSNCKSKNVGMVLMAGEGEMPKEQREHVEAVWRSKLTGPDRENN